MAGWARDVTVRFVFGVVSEEHLHTGFASVPRGFSRQLINELARDRRGLLASKSQRRLISEGRTLE
jgi:hypothetical protein